MKRLAVTPLRSLNSVTGLLDDVVAKPFQLARDPQSASLKTWHQILLAALVYEFASIAFIISFQPAIPLRGNPVVVFFYVCEVLFFFDFYVKFTTGYYKDGNLVYDVQLTRRRYLKSPEFVMDVVSIIPYGAIPATLSVSVMVLEVPKLLRVYRIPRYLSTVDDIYVRHFELLKLSKLLVGVVLLAHFLACIRFSFGYDDHHNNHWLPAPHEHPASTQTQYLQSLFWAFGIFSGLCEGELPRRINEFVLTIAVAVCGFCVFTYLCATFFLISKCEATNSEVAEARITQLKHILTFHRVPEHVRGPFIEYLRHYYAGTDTIDREVTKLLCPSIGKDVQVELLRDVIAKIPVFSGCKPEFIELLASLLERISLPAQSTLFAIGDPGDAMYIIHAGVLDVLGRKAKIRELRKNDYVGELSLFSSFPRSATVVTRTYCVLYKLSRFHTELVLGSFPTAADGIKQVVRAIIEKTQQKSSLSKSMSVSATRPPIKPRRESSKEDISTPEGTESWTGMTPAARKKSSLLVPAESTLNATESQAAATTPQCRTPRLLQRVLSIKKRRVSDAMKDVYDEYTAPRVSSVSPRAWWAAVLLQQALDCSSRSRLMWILGLQFILIFNWCLIPLQLSFPAFNHADWFIFMLNGATDAALWADIYVNFNLAFMQTSEKILDTTKTATKYLGGAFAMDLLCVLPYEAFATPTLRCVARVPRLVRAWRVSGHFHEVDRIHPLRSSQRLVMFAVLLFLLIHIVTCLYFSVTFLEGFSEEEEGWLLHNDVELHRVDETHFVGHGGVLLELGDPDLNRIATMQYLRSFYFATHKLTGLGKGIEPESDTTYVVALLFMFSGFFISAIVVDNVQKRFTASAHEEKEFFAVRSRIQGFLRHQHAPFAIHHRVNVFLDFWWASHRGTSIAELLSELPGSFKQEVLASIYTPALQTMALLTGVRPFLTDLENAVVANAVMMLFGQGEFIYREGDNAQGLYFLLGGRVFLTRDDVRSKVSRGGYFGTQILSVDTMQAGYSQTATAESGCVVLFLSRDALNNLYAAFPALPSELIQLEKRLLRTKLASSAFNSQELKKVVKAAGRVRWILSRPERAIDPDAKYVVGWETWLSIAMTVQWVIVLVNVCFGVPAEASPTTDAVTIALEVSFLLDLYIRSCLGYREFGNKIMDLKLIRRRYFGSWYFVLDVVALLPLFTLNWLPSRPRRELYNLNKVLRLLKVPNQFRALEQRYVKFTSELRLLKLVYYTFLVTHILGCIYFDFASHASGVRALILGETTVTSFGENSWALPKALEHADTLHQYFAATFWAFSIMSASNTGEPPQTTPQCLLTIMTLIVGFFLFAYVIGNFLDVIELSNAEHREFNTKMGSIRRLLAHFKLPIALQSKIKTLLFFKRFHSITQEEVLERYLPPSLMTDIRLLNLNAMIDKVPFLRNMDASITRILVAQFKQVLILKDEYVYRYGDDGTDMYFVFTGILTKFAPGRKNALCRPPTSEGLHDVSQQKINDVSAGDFFGENALFADAPRAWSVRSKSSSILYSLSRRSLEMVFDLYPDWKNRVLQTAKVQQKEQKQRRNSEQPLQRSVHSSPALQVGGSMPQPTDSIVQTALLSPGSWWSSPRWLNALSSVVESQSPLHLLWLRVVTACTFYVAFMLPSCVAFEACRTWHGLSLGANLGEVCCFVVFVVDVWVNLRLKETEMSMELYEVDIRKAYRHSRLVVDLVAAFPVQYLFYVLSPSSEVAWLSVNRCVKVLNVANYMHEIHRQSVSYESARLQAILLLYVLIIYWGACAYLLFADHEGYSTDWNSWFPSTELELNDDSSLSVMNLRLLRGIFFSVTAFIKKGRTFMPEDKGFIFAIVVCFVGLMVMAFMIGEIASLFISSIDNEVKYCKNHIAVEHTMARWKMSAPLNARVHVFLSNLWSSHRGVVYQEVFSTLPAQIRLETVLYIVDLPLQALVFQVFRPLVHGDGPSLARLTHAIADQLRFDSYPSGEHVLLEGRMPEGLFFVVSGLLVATTKARGPDHPVAQYMRGDYFGERGILTHSMSNVSVKTQMPCDLFLLSTCSLISILSADEFFSIVQIMVESLFHSLQRQQQKPGGRSAFPMPPFVWEQHLRKALQRQRMRWAVNTADGESSTPSKGEMLWSKLLTSVLANSDVPLSCFQLFRPFLEMAGPKCELFVRLSSQRRMSNVSAKVVKTPGGQLRGIVRQIGAVASSTSGRVIPILQGSSISRLSSMSRRSSVSRREDRSMRLFTERSQRVHEPPIHD